MEISNLIKDDKIAGIIADYKLNIDSNLLVKDYLSKNIDKKFKMVGLKSDISNKKISELSFSELYKVDLASKLNNKIIITGNLSLYLNSKEIDYFKKLFKKLSTYYNKRIIIIDNDVEIFFETVKNIYVFNNKKIIYKTNNYFDKKLYEYTKMPKIIEFIYYLEENGIEIDKTIEVHELIKDIYRRVS